MQERCKYKFARRDAEAQRKADKKWRRTGCRIRYITVRVLFVCLLAGMCLFAGSLHSAAQSTAPTNTALIWPNAQSQANSDDWIRLHHAQIRQMQPRLLVLNFVNGLSSEEETTKKVEAMIAALRKSSRYHGYAQPERPPSSTTKCTKSSISPTRQPLSDDQRMEGNSSKYPRTPDWKEGIQLPVWGLVRREVCSGVRCAGPGHARTPPVPVRNGGSGPRA